MSHPISEAAGYFAKKHDSINNKSNTTLGLIVPQQPSPLDDPLSSASPESRQQHRSKQQQQQQQQEDTNSDAKAQWQRMFKKISFNGIDDSIQRTRFHHSFQHKIKHSDQADDSDNSNNNNSNDNTNDNSDHDDNDSDGRHTIELSMMEPRFGHLRRHNPLDDDATLPTTEELEDEGIVQTGSTIQLSADNFDDTPSTDPPQQKTNYFAHPFSPDMSSPRPPELTIPANTYSGISSSARSNQYHSYSYHPPEQGENISTSDSETDDHNTHPNNTLFDGRARLHWGKTLDKIRLIANLQKPHVSQQNADTDASTSLVPFCSGLFDPPLVALSKDMHGRRPPPIILQFLHLNITDSVLDTQGINQWVFRIELQYGDVKWVIRRTIADFVSLHYTLKIKANLLDSVPAPPNFPSQLQSWINAAKETLRRDDGGYREHDGGKERKEIALHRREELTQYLRKLLTRAHYLVSYNICEFLEISAVSIVQDMGWKGKEGYLENRVNFVTPRFCHIFRPHLWAKEWVILRDSFIAFCTDIGSTSPTDVLVLDKSFRISDKNRDIIRRYHHHITLSNNFRRIEIKGSKRQIDEWREGIKKVQEESPWVKNHRFGSFAPIRYDSKVKWFVDAEDHYNAVAEAILSARTEIYICDWWLSPELYLRRPPCKNEEFRIDRLLQRKAREGVMIYVVVYKEMSLALPINSAHTKLWLQNCHPNIIVQRHPDHRSIDNNVLFWSHHEKIVVVDNRLAFIGGLDLCYGRYDSHAHSLVDAPAESVEYEVFPGQDYSNPRVKDFANVVNFDNTLVNRRITARMPWHDMTIGVVGPAARDVARHFVQRWNFLKASKGMHRSIVPFLMPKGEYVAARDESKFKGTCRTQVLRSSAEWSSGIEREHSIYNAYMECISKAKHYIYIENQFFVSSTTYDKVLRNKIGQAIVERIKKAHAKGEKFKIFIMVPLIPAFEGDLASSDASAARTVMHFQYVSISRGGNSILEKLKEAGIDATQYIGWYCLRNWAKNKPSDTGETNNSTTSSNSKNNSSNSNSNNYNYNSSNNNTNNNNSNNNSKKKKKDRRIDSGTAINQQQCDDSAVALDDVGQPSPQQSSTPTNAPSRSSLSSSSSSSPITSSSKIASPVMATDTVVDDPLQNNAYLESAAQGTEDDRKYYVSELIYIHDKLLIVDDRIVLVGSANINDRSQLGNRDSEIAMLVEDTDIVLSYMDGKEYKASKFALSLRLQLMKEHLGLLEFDDWDKLMEEKDEDGLIKHGNVNRASTLPLRTRTVTEEEIQKYEETRPDQVLDDDGLPKMSRTTTRDNDPIASQHSTLLPDEKRALDPLADHFYYNVWRGTAHKNTLVYRDLFRCVPDDTVTTFTQHRQFLPNVPHGHVADPSLSEHTILKKLSKIQGHLVEFPTDYLKDENMLGSYLRETVTPMIIFT